MKIDITADRIGVLADLPLGSHYCLFYETHQDLLKALVSYFKAGLDRGEYCLWVLSDLLTEEEAWDALQKEIPELETYRSRQSIEIVPCSAWYAPAGGFDPKALCDSWRVILDAILARGYTGLRSTGDKCVIDKTEWSVFCGYEEEINRCIVGSRMVFLCTYHMLRCGAAELLDVVKNHQQAATMRHGNFGLLESPELKATKAELVKLNEELKQKEERLQALASELILTEERERKLMAGDLHDSIGQSLIATKLMMEHLAATISQSDVTEKLQEIAESVTRIISDTRSLMYKMSHPVLDMFGLEVAIRSLVHNLQDEHNIRGNFSTDSEPKPLDKSTAVLLFSAAKELISNVIKHAQTNEITVRMSRVGDTMELVVEDHGVGFDVSQITECNELGGFGLFSVSERMTNVGGEFRIISTFGHGTTVTLIAPLLASRKD